MGNSIPDNSVAPKRLLHCLDSDGDVDFEKYYMYARERNKRQREESDEEEEDDDNDDIDDILFECDALATEELQHMPLSVPRTRTIKRQLESVPMESHWYRVYVLNPE